jgi:hypothetical protein
MSKQTENSRFIVFSSPQFYQQLLGGFVSYEQLGSRIIRKIKTAQAFRQVQKVREYGELLVNFPVKEFRLIGQYYLVWCDCRESNYDTEELERILEQTSSYKTKVMLSLAAFEGYKGKMETSLRHYTETLKTSPSISDYIVLSRSIAALKAAEGFHKSALQNLESLIPLLKYAEPQVYYDFLNSYAVELGEAGRLYEARNICDLVLASPFAFAYPEWHATAEDLRGASRSRVAVNLSTLSNAKLFYLSAVERSTAAAEPAQPSSPASVISLPDWKMKMGKHPKGDHNDPPSREKSCEEATEKDLCLRLLSLVVKKDLSIEQFYQVIEFVEKLPSMADFDAEQE